ncbi:acetyl-CoA synthetase-like protein [Gymnopus androsaceus JB14]|uniref:Acetyl-CoA synthetase-like protein n=1 Tax=Gymnopus androsaceus JB14 TaxID=1447944 RepID=A0A6A4H1Q9_9AGAR|nr:acetyl-CoA synthetase-like protein [Gymnopus androsaceus JB14]
MIPDPRDDHTQQQLAYWARHLSGSKALELRTDYFRPAKLSGTVEQVPLFMNKAVVAALREFAASNGASLHVALLAAFRAAIFRFTGEDSGAIGMMKTTNWKSNDFLENVQAINLQSVMSQSTFEDLIVETRKHTVAALENSDISFPQVVAHLVPQHDSSRNALIQLMLSLHDLSEISVNEFGREMNQLFEDLKHAFIRLDLSFHVFVRGNELRGSLIYQRDLFFPNTIQTFSDVILRVIKAATKNPSTLLPRLQLSTADDLKRLAVWNDTDVHFAGLDLSIGDRFHQAAAQYQTSVAVVDGTLSLTYSELDEQSDRLASWISQKGMPTESVVGICMGRSALLVISYLGCLKAGMAYMPLDKSLPLKRMRQMVETACCQLVFIDGNTALSEDVLTIDLTTQMHIFHSTPIITLPTVSPGNLSNIMFTSGSTGVPKGVMLEHRGMVNLCAPETTNWVRKRKQGFTTTIGFDPAGQQIFTTLLSGSELHCLPDNGVFDVEEFRKFIIDSGIQRCTLTTSVLDALMDTEEVWLARSSLEHIALTGEKLVVSQVIDCSGCLPHLTFGSEYGAVECSVFTTDFSIDSSHLESRMCRIPVAGRALPNNRIYVVDETFSPVPPGVLGQIVLAGVHLGRGYLNRPDLTAERFVQMPSDSFLGPQRLYCTGDLGYWTSGGQVQCVGRMDTQVKIRGQRLEIEEVETVLKDHPAVESSAVAVVLTPQGDQLVAYVRLTVDISIKEENVFTELSTIKQYLRNILPEYMVPNQVLRIDALPLNSNGKLNRKLLASWNYMASHDTLACSQNIDVDHIRNIKPVSDEKDLTVDEATVQDIFARYLGISPYMIGLHDNLFDIGGHSLIAARIITAIRQHFRVCFSVTLFYSNATVAGVITNLVQCQVEDNGAPAYLYSLDTQDICPASDAQTRLWVEEQMYPGLSRYHVGFQRKMTGLLDTEALIHSFLALLNRHEALRTVLEMHDSTLMQRVVPLNQCPPIHFVEMQALSPIKAEEDARTFLVEEHARPFNLAKDIPTRLAIVKISSTLHFVSAVIHHIATDGWSNIIIDRDLAQLYNSFSAGISGSINRFKKESCRHSSTIGLTTFRSAKPLELRVDYFRPQTRSGQTKEIPIAIGRTLVSALRQLGAKHRTSLYVVILAVFRATIFRVTGEDDGILGMANARRPQTELENIVGFFVNIHAIRLPVNQQSTFEDLIMETRKVTAAALDNSEIPFDKVVAHLAPKRYLSRNPLVQLMFILQDFSGVSEGMHSHGLQGIDVEEIRSAINQHDLSLHLYVEGQNLKGFFMYETDLFFSSTVQTVSNLFHRVIKAVIENPGIPLSRLPLTTADDLKELSTWNETIINSPSLDLSVGDRFRQVVAQHSTSIAVVDASLSLTYAMLDEQSDHLASWLISQKFPLESVIGIFMDRSVLLVVTYLGCLKAGMAYMPLEKNLPLDRMRFMAHEANCQLIITDQDCPLSNDILTIDLTCNTQIILLTPITTLPTISPRNLSNIMFTSGSTGVPKGVMLEHRGMINLCAPETTNWTKKKKNGLTTTLGFDPSGQQIFTTLLSGSELHCLPDNGVFDIEEFQKFVVNSGIQRCSLTSSVLGALMNTTEDWLSHSSLEHIALGGEKLLVSQIIDCSRHSPHLEFTSEYGPVEASIWSTYFVIHPSRLESRMCRIPIGRALPNTQVYIVDETFSPVPSGILGQIVLAGVHLARGYLNQPDLTAERFVQIPADSMLGPQRLYCTGDLGYWTSDGQVQFVGRMDTQVKIRGQRLEVEEIETIIKDCPAVDSTAVAVVPTLQGDQLVAYVRLVSDVSSREEGVLSLWKHHYNRKELYGELENHSAIPDSAIWLSMYTGKPIPFEEMQEWLQDTISQIPASLSDHVLEIGVGTGKITLNIVHCVSSITGIDLSSTALQFLETQIEQKDLVSKFSVFHCAAHELETLPTQHYSLVVINSVVQYFPSSSYLIQVISSIIDLMPEGRVFIGDVRSYALTPFHNLERVLATFKDETSIEDVREAMDAYDKAQRELLLSPSFFFELQAKFPQIVHVEIKPKYMAVRNELSRYRFNVILHVGAQPKLVTPNTWFDCTHMESPLSTLQSILQECSVGVVGALNIAVHDMEHVQALLETVYSSDATAETVFTLRQQHLKGLSHVEFTPAALVNMAKGVGWNVALDTSFQGISGNYLRAIFTRGIDDFVGNFPTPKFSGPSHNTFQASDEDVSVVLKAIQEQLLKSLPLYMIPTRIIRVESLPLNRSGKLDRKILSSTEYMESHNIVESHKEEPATEMECQVLSIFARALNCQPDVIDIRKSFFNLGGHSLMATLVIATIRREMGVDLSIIDFFHNPTVKEIAALISSNSYQPASFKSKAELVGANATIVINDKLPGPILFMFPEATGFASIYSSAFENIGHKIVAFGDEHWGESPDIDESVSSVVSTLIPSIREHQPHGPYFLSGWSLGGFMALEAAIQLQNAGEAVGLLMMIDSHFGTKLLSEPQSLSHSELKPLLSIVDDESSWLNQFMRANQMMTKYGFSKEAYTGRVVLLKAERVS